MPGPPRLRNSKDTHPDIESFEGGKVVSLLYYGYHFPQHRIGALFDENSARVNEVLKNSRGRRGRSSNGVSTVPPNTVQVKENGSDAH